MRVINPSVAPAVAKPTESKPTATRPGLTELKPTVTALPRPALGFPKNDAFGGPPSLLPHSPGGCFPLPPIFRPDTQARTTQANQLEQIAHGVGTGAITAQEAEALLKEQTGIADYRRQAMSDGFLSQEENLRLNLMQAKAALNTFVAANNGDRTSGFDPLGQHQAGQLFQIARGVRDGNITHFETGGLLRDQVKIADARGDADTLEELFEVRDQLRSEDFDIRYHSQPGTQFEWKPLPFPRPVPVPVPMPRPEPLPLPGPRPLPQKPEFHILPFKGVING